MTTNPISESDRPFIVGYGPHGFSMLGMAGSFYGLGMTGSDLRNYDCITRVEPFDSAKPEHREFIPLRDYALRRMARASGANKHGRSAVHGTPD